jgi:hypothetical protein
VLACHHWTTVDFLNRLEINSKTILFRRGACHHWTTVDFLNRLEINSKTILFRRGTPTSRAFFAQGRDAPRLPWFEPMTSPRAKPPLPLHHTLICVHIQFWLYSYYTTPSVNQLFWGTKRIQIKNLSTTKFYNFLRSTTFILGVFPFEVI